MKNKIRKKWTLAMIVIITGAFLALSGGSVFYFQNNLRGQTIFNEQQKLEQICNHLQYVQQEVQLLVRQLIVDTEFNSYIMEETDEDVFHKLVSEDHMRQVLVRFSNLNQYYYGINVVTEDGEVYSSNSYEGDFDSDALWYQELPV
jgi:hypothetical protein